MLAHAVDLRTWSKNEALADAVKTDFRKAPLDAQHISLCEWAEKLTLSPAQCNREDVQRLREAGFSDEQITSAAQIIGFFNHLNRLADGLGIDLEPGMK
jgi:uncharacterized peroxidase-related enzyme